MKIVILDACTLGEDICLSPLTDNFETVVYNSTSPEQISERITGFDIVITNKLKINADTVKNAEIKLVCVTATGYDNVDLNFCKERNIAVCNVVGYSTESVAQVTIAMALSLATHIPEYTEFVNDGSYSNSNSANRLSPTFYELSGKTWGIVGYGNIGKKVADVAKALGCRVLVNKRTPIESEECISLNQLLKESDIISIHTPLTQETKNLIGKREVMLMKPNAIVINVARGAVCNEEALKDAILGKKIAGLGIDVYSKEPFDSSHPFNELKGLKNVCLTPHMAWGAYEARQRCITEISENIKAFIDGNKRNRII